MSDRATRLIGLYAAFAAVSAVVLSPLLALSWFATDSGTEALEIGTVSAWADPGRDLAGSLLTWASHDRVYATYLQAFALLFPAVLLCALAVRSGRSGVGRNERWGWRIALTGYGLASLGLVVAFAVLFSGSAAGDALNVIFLTLIFPGLALSAIGSTTLGIALLRSPYAPRLTAWLLVLALPSMLVVPDALGHNSLGMLPILIAWGATGLRLSQIPSDGTALVRGFGQ